MGKNSAEATVGTARTRGRQHMNHPLGLEYHWGQTVSDVINLHPVGTHQRSHVIPREKGNRLGYGADRGLGSIPNLLPIR